MRWEFMSNMQDDLNLWTWFSSFSSRSLLQNFWDLFELWEHVNTYGISLIKNLPSVGMKASTLWNFNVLNLESIMFSHVWSNARFKQWRAMMISIEGLLEDEQGLSMGEMLTVKFRQPSHEFTFGVGMSFTSYPLVLTPLI
jgi:hypothetical protein